MLYILFAKSLLFDLLAKITSRDISTQYTILVGTIILYTATTTVRLWVFKMQQQYEYNTKLEVSIRDLELNKKTELIFFRFLNKVHKQGTIDEE